MKVCREPPQGTVKQDEFANSWMRSTKACPITDIRNILPMSREATMEVKKRGWIATKRTFHHNRV